MKLLGLGAAILVGLLGSALILSRALTTPEQAALSRDPSPILVTEIVAQGVLEDTVIFEAIVRARDVVSLPIPDGPAVVTAETMAVGETIELGDVLIEIAGRPIVVLFGEFAMWRPFESGMEPGPDVEQLQFALREYGTYDGRIDGRFGSTTEAAVRSLYSAVGYPLRSTSVTVAPHQLVFLRSERQIHRLPQVGDVLSSDNPIEVRAPSLELHIEDPGIFGSMIAPGQMARIGTTMATVESVDRQSARGGVVVVRTREPLPFEADVVLPFEVVLAATDGPQLLVPMSAVRHDSIGSYVTVRAPDGSESRVPVEVLLQAGGVVAVASDALSVGDEVVVGVW